MKVRLRAGSPLDVAWLRPGKSYTVLELQESPPCGFRCRIASEQDGTPALFPLAELEIVDPSLPPCWIATVGATGQVTLTPKAWAATGFWEAYFDGDAAARLRYDEVVRELTSE